MSALEDLLSEQYGVRVKKNVRIFDDADDVKSKEEERVDASEVANLDSAATAKLNEVEVCFETLDSVFDPLMDAANQAAAVEWISTPTPLAEPSPEESIEGDLGKATESSSNAEELDETVDVETEELFEREQAEFDGTESQLEEEESSPTSGSADEAVGSQTETVQFGPQARFRPEWEVDQFLWPAMCEKVGDAVKSELSKTVNDLRERFGEHKTNVVAISHAADQSGSTTIALALARSALGQGFNVALVDLNHRHPRLMERLGVAFDIGIDRLQDHDTPLEEVCVTALEDDICLVPLTSSVAAEFCVGDRVQQLLGKLSDNFDFVIVDASPEVRELLVKTGFSFGAIVVATSANTDVGLSQVRQIRDSAWPVGVIENFAA